jgi:cell wall-associated NlpC family hydrolase
MKKIFTAAAAGILALMLNVSVHAFQEDGVPTRSDDFEGHLKNTIGHYLGKPYVWGASGIKSFDCSGFVWRVLNENGIYFKRTSARKLYMSLDKTSPASAWNFGNIVFFDNLKHCGIVYNRKEFYHAAVSKGTNLSDFDPFWREKIVGVRQFKLK